MPPPEPEFTPDSGHPEVPTPLLWASRVVYVEGVLVAGYGLVDAAHTSSHRLLLGLTAALFFVAYGAGLCWCAWGMARLRRWSRGPVLFSQLVMLGLAANFGEAGAWAYTAVLVVLAAAILIGMLAPSSVRALEEGFGPPEH